MNTSHDDSRLPPRPRGEAPKKISTARSVLAARLDLSLLALSVLALSVLVLAAVLVACGDNSREATSAGVPSAANTGAPANTTEPMASGSASAEATPESPPRPQNVILLTIDSLRHDMPWQGYATDIAPNLTKLAQRGVVYPRAYAISSFTSKSVGAILSGRYPSTLYRGPSFFTKYSNSNTFFPELLQKAGVRTMAGHAHGYFDRGKNLRQGFDLWKVVPGIKWNAETDESVTSHKMTPMAIEMLSDAANTKGRFFMWLHYMDPHDKYTLHAECPDFGHRARSLYDNEVCYTDLWIQKLLDFCEKQPWWKDTVVIISSDHGEAFGEHNMWKHAFALWEVLNRVPMMIAGPGIEPRRIEERRSHIDLAPTILELMGVAVPASLAGKSLVPELYGREAPSNREPILLDLPADTYNPPTRATIKGDYKLIEDPGNKFHLYHLAEDPGETHNLVASPKHADVLAEMKATHARAWAEHPYVAPWGGKKLIGGRKADGPFGPDGIEDADVEPGPP